MRVAILLGAVAAVASAFEGQFSMYGTTPARLGQSGRGAINNALQRTGSGCTVAELKDDSRPGMSKLEWQVYTRRLKAGIEMDPLDPSQEDQLKTIVKCDCTGTQKEFQDAVDEPEFLEIIKSIASTRTGGSGSAVVGVGGTYAKSARGCVGSCFSSNAREDVDGSACRCTHRAAQCGDQCSTFEADCAGLMD